MVPPFLIFVAVGQAVLMVVTGVWLAVTHGRALRRDVRRANELAEARDVLQRLLSKRILEEEAIERLDRLDSRTLAHLVQEFGARRTGSDRRAAFGVIQKTHWFAKLEAEGRSRFWWRRLTAARAISALGASDHLLVVHELLDDPVPAVRLAAATSLERIPSPGIARAILIRAAASHGAERNYLLEILAESDTISLPVLTQWFREANEAGDEGRLCVLMRLGSRAAFPALLPYVARHASSDNDEVRIAAAACLRSFPHPESSGALRRLLTDRRWEIRARAAASLGAIGAIEAIPDLKVALGDPNWWVRLRSAIALRLVGHRGIEALRSIETTPDRFAFDMAQYVLGLDDGGMAEYVGGTAFDVASITAPRMRTAS